jgi:hypothetical protein
VTPNTDRTVSRSTGSVVHMENNEERMRQWCRMWNEDPALAHELMSPACVQWSGQTPGLDSVVGPAEQVRFLEGYRARHVNTFRPRVLADGGDHFAYLWDVDKAGGQKVTGFDVNILHDGRIAENWTFVGEWRDTAPDPAYTGGDDLDKVLDGWLRWRAGDPVDVVAAGFGYFSGAAGPLARPEPAVLTPHREPILDPGRGTIAFLWTGPAGGGADLLSVRDGRVARAWSLTATRSFRY